MQMKIDYLQYNRYMFVFFIEFLSAEVLLPFDLHFWCPGGLVQDLENQGGACFYINGVGGEILFDFIWKGKAQNSHTFKVLSILMYFGVYNIKKMYILPFLRLGVGY